MLTILVVAALSLFLSTLLLVKAPWWVKLCVSCIVGGITLLIGLGTYHLVKGLFGLARAGVVEVKRQGAGV